MRSKISGRLHTLLRIRSLMATMMALALSSAPCFALFSAAPGKMLSNMMYNDYANLSCVGRRNWTVLPIFHLKKQRRHLFWHFSGLLYSTLVIINFLYDTHARHEKPTGIKFSTFLWLRKSNFTQLPTRKSRRIGNLSQQFWATLFVYTLKITIIMCKITSPFL